MQKYRFLGTIGSGGMGVIYKAQHLLLNRTVAIKMMRSNLPSAKMVQRFQLEGKAVTALSHEYIVKLYEFGVTSSGQPYMVMDYVDGQTLDDLLKRQTVLQDSECRQIFAQVCEALGHAHRRSVLHRDIKPSNIMITHSTQGSREVRIMDFGIAKFLDDTAGEGQHLTKTGDAVGSPLYMSPEQVTGRKVDHRSDLYSLGCVMYECLTGAPPFSGSTAFQTMMMHVNDSPMPLRQASLGRDIDSHWHEIILRLLKKDPDQRYQSMDELKQALLTTDASTALESQRGKDNNKDMPHSSGKLTPAGKPARTVLIPAVIAGLVLALTGAIILLPKMKNLADRTPSVQVAPPTKKDVTGTEVGSTRPAGVERNVVSDADDAIQGTSQSTSPELDLSLRSTAGIPVDDEKLRGACGKSDYLERLHLDTQHITDSGLDCLRTKKMTWLSLKETLVKNLRPLRGMATMKSLILDGTDLNSEGVDAICTMPNLKELGVSRTHINDGDLLKLARLKRLAHLDITHCENVHPAAVKELESKSIHLAIRDDTGRLVAKEKQSGTREF